MNRRVIYGSQVELDNRVSFYAEGLRENDMLVFDKKTGIAYVGIRSIDYNGLLSLIDDVRVHLGIKR